MSWRVVSASHAMVFESTRRLQLKGIISHWLDGRDYC